MFLRLEPARIVGKLPERIKRYSYRTISKFIALVVQTRRIANERLATEEAERVELSEKIEEAERKRIGEGDEMLRIAEESKNKIDAGLANKTKLNTEVVFAITTTVVLTMVVVFTFLKSRNFPS